MEEAKALIQKVEDGEILSEESEDTEDGTHISHLTYSPRFPNHMKSAVEDMFRTIGEVETEQLT